MIYLVSLAPVCLALNTFSRGFDRAKYYTRPSLLFCQPPLAHSNITPTVSRHSRIKCRKLIFSKRKQLLLTVCSNRFELGQSLITTSYPPEYIFQFCIKKYLRSADKMSAFSCVVQQPIYIWTKR